tara:strand:- start:1052 stop:1279 length:228 start_codon:yes stop_codon:yes gene_type:complete
MDRGRRFFSMLAKALGFPAGLEADLYPKGGMTLETARGALHAPSFLSQPGFLFDYWSSTGHGKTVRYVRRYALRF